MGAVRNSNTRASHASVDMAPPERHQMQGSADAKMQGSTAGGMSMNGTGGNSGALDSPHLAPDTPDRRPSFSYLRRASDRRRRRRMLVRNDDDIGSPRQNYRDFVYPGSSSHNRTQRESESGQDSDAQLRRDQVGERPRHSNHEHRLRRSDQIYDEEGGDFSPVQESQEHGSARVAGYQQYADTVQYKTQSQVDEDKQISSEQQRRQSINDRLTEAVSDVMDFVREESFKRGKRHSMIRRRGYNTNVGNAASGGHVGSGFAGATGAGRRPTDEAELDSEELTGLCGTGSMDEKLASQRRRRIMRHKSPRRSTTQLRAYNDSDTGSCTSLGHDPGSMIGGKAQHFALQQHGGSAQDASSLYGSGGRGTAILVEQHRRHQSADASARAMHRDSIQDVYYNRQRESEYETALANSEAPESLPVGALESRDLLPSIRPIPVGSSPPPVVGSAEAKLVAARRQRDVEEELDVDLCSEGETAIHVGGGSDELVDKRTPGRFIAPKVAPLSSPSALLMPDEEIIPPDVPFRGRRLPQIPGSNIIKSAADFLHSSFYRRHGRASSGSMSAVADAVATTPLMATVAPRFACDDNGEDDFRAGEPVFPLVSESPTSKGTVEPVLPATASIVKKIPLETASSIEGSSSINFPRVSFSPTNVQSSGHDGNKYLIAKGSSSTASMIATQASGGTQSTVLAPPVAGPADSLIGERGGTMAWARGRRNWKEDEDEWF